MLNKITSLKSDAVTDLQAINSQESIEEFRLKYLSRKGLLSLLFEDLKTVPKEEKAASGKSLNELKIFINSEFSKKESEFSGNDLQEDKTDITLPGRKPNEGSKHVISSAIEEICGIFQGIGFKVYEGKEIEDEFHNFDALNTPDHHPARDMQDTFYLDSKDFDKQYLLRTHTSPGQIHAMRNNKPPIRIVLPGKVFRNEAISSRSLAQFHQIEGLYVDKRVTFRELRGTIDYFARQFFGDKLKTRMRPSFFPFTEPSAEIDVECFLCNGKGCRICKFTGWVEIAGCGMVSPKVFEACGYDPYEYKGFAFGMGIERTLLIKYGIPDIRLLIENDIRFLKQFK
ncbi:phenylalanine--tRNA ligase subunit alpha [soil metagenome]